MFVFTGEAVVVSQRKDWIATKLVALFKLGHIVSRGFARIVIYVQRESQPVAEISLARVSGARSAI